MNPYVKNTIYMLFKIVNFDWIEMKRIERYISKFDYKEIVTIINRESNKKDEILG